MMRLCLAALLLFAVACEDLVKNEPPRIEKLSRNEQAEYLNLIRSFVSADRAVRQHEEAGSGDTTPSDSLREEIRTRCQVERISRGSIARFERGFRLVGDDCPVSFHTIAMGKVTVAPTAVSTTAKVASSYQLQSDDLRPANDVVLFSADGVLNATDRQLTPMLRSSNLKFHGRGRMVSQAWGELTYSFSSTKNGQFVKVGDTEYVQKMSSLMTLVVRLPDRKTAELKVKAEERSGSSEILVTLNGETVILDEVDVAGFMSRLVHDLSEVR